MNRRVLRIVTNDAGYGTFHCSSQGHCSWYEFARAILERAGVTPVSFEPMKSTALDRPAKRPLFSVLRNYALEQTIGDPMRHWHEGLNAYLMAQSRPAS